MIADPEQMKASTLDAWVRDLDNYVITDAFAGMAPGGSDGDEKKRS
jgi:hypothetical protein